MKPDIKLLRMRSIKELQSLAKAIQEVIRKKMTAPDEYDIAREHSGEPDLVAEVLETRERGGGYTTVLQTIYCSRKRCARCPHGPYRYAIRRNKRRQTRMVSYVGMVVSRGVLQRIASQAKPLLYAYQVVPRPRKDREGKKSGSSST